MFEKITESQNWIIDYDTERGMYRVSYFIDNCFQDEVYFDAYENIEINSERINESCKFYKQNINS